MPPPIVYEIIVTGANEESVNGIYRYDSSFLTTPRYYNTKNNNKWLRIMRPGFLGKYGIQDNPIGGGGAPDAYYITTTAYPFFILPNNTVNFTLGNLGSNPLPTAKGYWRYKNFISGGGTGKLIARSFDRDALKYIKSIESVTSPSYPITEDGKNKIESFIKQIKQVIPWNSFVAWTFIWGQNANQTGFTDDKYNGIIKSFGGLGEGIVVSANSSTFFASDGMSFSSPGGLLAISPSAFFTGIKSIFGVLYPTTNTYFGSSINQNILSVAGGSGPSIKSYGNLYYKDQAVYSRITRNSIYDIQTNGTSVWTSLNKYRSLGTVFDTNSTSNYSNGIKQFTASSLLSPNASDFNSVTIGGGIPIGKIPFVFASNLVLTENQMLQLHNIYKNTLGKDLPNSEL